MKNIAVVFGITAQFLAMAFTAGARAQDDDSASRIPPSGLLLGEERVIASDVLGEERYYYVRLPKSYNDKTLAKAHYPVIVVLDGQLHLSFSSGVTAFLSEAYPMMPEAIVVAIPSGEPLVRMRDYSVSAPAEFPGGFPVPEGVGGGSAYLDFLQTELFPKIDADYRTNGFRIFVGHSLGGLFVADLMLKTPDVAACYIAEDPSIWWDDMVTNKRLAAAIEDGWRSKARIYVGEAERPVVDEDSDLPDAAIQGGLDHHQAMNDFIRLLLNEDGDGPRADAKIGYFPEYNHGTVPVVTLAYGLSHCFHGYTQDSGSTWTGASDIMAHFAKFSAEIGHEFLPQEQFLKSSAQILLMDSAEYPMADPEKGRELLELATELYPTSSYARSRLGDFYKGQGECKRASKLYREALEIDPENTGAEAGLNGCE